MAGEQPDRVVPYVWCRVGGVKGLDDGVVGLCDIDAAAEEDARDGDAPEY